MNKTAIQLHDRLRAFITGAPDDFDALALAVFRFQFEHHPAFRAFCELKHCTPANVTRWQEIPAVPTRSFKDMTVACFPIAEAVAEFHTSGTTRGETGRHYLCTLDLYDAGCVPNFHAHLFPTGPVLPLISLVPDAPHSSLAHMIRILGATFVEKLTPPAGPVCIIGTAFHFLNLFDAGFALPLPPGSRVMETGGFKGRSREVTRAELHRLIADRLAVPPTHIINEYGMTELSTQFYDLSLRHGQPTAVKSVPHWARVMILDPHTDTEAAPGQIGLIRVCDLANLWSAVVVQTEDLGVAHPAGFEVLGRAPGATPRGCSLTAEAVA